MSKKKEEKKVCFIFSLSKGKQKSVLTKADLEIELKHYLKKTNLEDQFGEIQLTVNLISFFFNNHVFFRN